MRKHFSLGVLLLIAGLSVGLDGCDSSTNSTIAQQVDDITWMPDGSSLIAYVRKTSYSAIDNSQYTGVNVYRVNLDGSLGNAIISTDQVVPSDPYYTSILPISPDGKQALAQFGSNIYKIDLSGGSANNIIQNTYLFGASPDLRYALTTTSSAQVTSKLLVLYDLSSSPIRMLSPSQTRLGVVSAHPVWVDSGRYALTIYDSTDSFGAHFHVGIYDTAGNVARTIPNAAVPPHASAYATLSHDLFVQNQNLGLDKINLQTGKRSTIIATDTVESMDASPDGSLVVYISGSQAAGTSYPATAVNVANGHTASIGSGYYSVKISPNGQKAAYITKLDQSGNQAIAVNAVSVPQ